MSPIIIIVLQIILWSCLFLIIYSYILFPLILRFLARNKQRHTDLYSDNELPRVSVLMSLYNEESIILEKLNHLQQQNYPSDLLHIYIGSDCSDDRTNEIVDTYIQEHQLGHFHFFPNTNRQGKPGVINQLFAEAAKDFPLGEQHVIFITDASVLPEPNVTRLLARHFKNPRIGLVDSLQKHLGLRKQGISQSEDEYISKEVDIKSNESLANGRMMGPFGGCYAIRSQLYKPVPSNFLVDDFYLAMHVLERGYLAINDTQAVCWESVSHEIHEEYRRKRRISAGNFQNLQTYAHLLIPKGNGIAFNFWGHKVIRWLGPFLIIVAYLSNITLAAYGNIFYSILLVFQTSLIFIIPIFDLVLERLQVNMPLLRSIRYFFMMNLALLEGFINYLKGVKSNVWQPTKRPNTTE